MTYADNRYQESRDVWGDCNHRQEWEHDLINRKTTWWLTGQTILFAAYGVTLKSGTQKSDFVDKSGEFHRVVACSGFLVAVVTLIGVLAIINSKFLSWRKYRKYYPPSKKKRTVLTFERPHLPGPLDEKPLRWGVNTFNTILTLLPDVLLPVIFAGAWLFLLKHRIW
jgi:hypothetical protein